MTFLSRITDKFLINTVMSIGKIIIKKSVDGDDLWLQLLCSPVKPE